MPPAPAQHNGAVLVADPPPTPALIALPGETHAAAPGPLAPAPLPAPPASRTARAEPRPVVAFSAPVPEQLEWPELPDAAADDAPAADDVRSWSRLARLDEEQRRL